MYYLYYHVLRVRAIPTLESTDSMITMFWYLFTYIQELALSEDDISSDVSGQTEPDKVRSKSKAS